MAGADSLGGGLNQENPLKYACKKGNTFKALFPNWNLLSRIGVGLRVTIWSKGPLWFWFDQRCLHAWTDFQITCWCITKSAALLIAHIPRFFHVFTLITEKLHYLPLSAGIQFKITGIFLVYKATLGLAPRYLYSLIMRPLSAISDRPLCSLDLLITLLRTFTSQLLLQSLLWNRLPAIIHAHIFSDSSSSTAGVLKLFKWGPPFQKATLATQDKIVLKFTL